MIGVLERKFGQLNESGFLRRVRARWRADDLTAKTGEVASDQ